MEWKFSVLLDVGVVSAQYPYKHSGEKHKKKYE